MRNVVIVKCFKTIFSAFRLEAAIEDDYTNALRQACFREKSYSEFIGLLKVANISLFFLHNIVS